LGAIEISQSVNANRASIVISGETPDAKSMTISTSCAVLSTTCLILIFPLSLALMMLSMSPVVVTPKGNSRIISVFLSVFSILALTFTLLPLLPC